MPTYTLTYFNVRGRGELIRLIFHAAGLKFVDKRVEGKDWPALKPKIPHGTLPALEVDNDGKIFGQSIAIARFAANEGGLAGKNSREKLRADEIVDTVVEFLGKYAKFAFEEKDESKKAEMRKEFVEKTIPSFLENMKGLLVANGGNYFVGTSLTWADLAIFNTMDIIDGFDSGAVNKFKQLTELRERIKKLPNLSSYLNERPKTDF